MKKISILNLAFSFFLMVLNTVALFKIGISNPSRMGAILTFYFTILIPIFLRFVFSVRIHPILIFTYELFIFLAHFLGSVINLYKYVEWYDLFIHTLSGFFSCYLAIYLLIHFDYYENRTFLFQITYILGIVFFIAGIWEIVEFSFDVFLGFDTQHSLTLGVRDTMEDMIVSFLGALFFLTSYFWELFYQKEGITRYPLRFMK